MAEATGNNVKPRLLTPREQKISALHGILAEVARIVQNAQEVVKELEADSVVKP